MRRRALPPAPRDDNKAVARAFSRATPATAPMQFGVYTFVETERDPATGRPINVERTLAETMAEIELAAVSGSTCSRSANI
jgi:hypothetical protein